MIEHHAIARLENRLAIADVVHGYALAIRQRRYAQAAALFTAEASFEICEAAPGSDKRTTRTRLDGRQAVLDYLLAAGTRATSLMEAQVFPTPTRTLGEYDDSFRRESSGWRFASRRYTIFRAAAG